MDAKYFSDENADLADILTASSVRSQFEKTPRYFVPQGEFDRIVTREAIRDTLYSRTEAEDAVLVDYIVKDARKLFAIVVLSDLSGPSYLTQAMYLFRDHNFSDSNLPIEDPPISEDGQFDLPAHPLRRLSKFWRGAMIHTFCYEQWKLLVPVFLPDGVNHDLGAQIIPFIDKSDEAREGSSGSVRRYTVHPDHIQGFATGGKVRTASDEYNR